MKIDQTIETAEIISSAERIASQLADIANLLDQQGLRLDRASDRGAISRLALVCREMSERLRRQH